MSSEKRRGQAAGRVRADGFFRREAWDFGEKLGLRVKSWRLVDNDGSLWGQAFGGPDGRIFMRLDCGEGNVEWREGVLDPVVREGFPGGP